MEDSQATIQEDDQIHEKLLESLQIEPRGNILL